MKMYGIKGKQTQNELQKHTRIGYISKHLQINLNKALRMALKTHWAAFRAGYSKFWAYILM